MISEPVTSFLTCTDSNEGRDGEYGTEIDDDAISRGSEGPLAAESLVVGDCAACAEMK